MHYARLTKLGQYDYQLPDVGNVEWDATHFCPPGALTPEEADQFRVVPLIETPEPTYDPIYQTCQRDGGEFVSGQWQFKWKLETLTTEQSAANLLTLKQQSVKQIDNDADEIYRAALGDRSTEYAQAEADALAFKAAGYTGDVPASVAAWAQATGKSAQWAADDTLATATTWRNAQAAIRQNRLMRKEAVRQATTADEVRGVLAQWAGFRIFIREALGL